MEIDPVQALRARHEAQGLRLHARTAIPGWLGERLDVGWAIDVMHPLAGYARWATTEEAQKRKATGGDSPPRDVRQLPRRRLDRRARLQQHRRRIPCPADELVAGAVRHSRLDDAVAEADLLLLHVHCHRRLRRPAHLALEPLDVLLRGTQAGDA